jgi:hypothetical protein
MIRTVIEPCKDGSGNWYWAIYIDGGLYADGEETTKEDARRKVRLNVEEIPT